MIFLWHLIGLVCLFGSLCIFLAMFGGAWYLLLPALIGLILTVAGVYTVRKDGGDVFRDSRLAVFRVAALVGIPLLIWLLIVSVLTFFDSISG